MNEEAGPKEKQASVVDMSDGESKVRCCKEQPQHARCSSWKVEAGAQQERVLGAGRGLLGGEDPGGSKPDTGHRGAVRSQEEKEPVLLPRRPGECEP